MRDPRRTLSKLTRRKRRAILVALLITTAPVAAQGPAHQSVRILPPLPLQTTPVANTVQANPFCEPPLGSELPVQLASGSDASLIRLKPIGAAVGLHPIDSTTPTRVQRSGISIETPPASTIQSNPLIESAHHNNRDLVDTTIAGVATPADPTASRRDKTQCTGVDSQCTDAAKPASKIVLLPVAPIEPTSDESAAVKNTAVKDRAAATPAVATDRSRDVAAPLEADDDELVPVPPIVASTEPSLAEAASDQIDLPMPVRVQSGAADSSLAEVPTSLAAEAGTDSEPIFFSLSDEWMDNSAPSEPDREMIAPAPAMHSNDELVAQTPNESLELQSDNDDATQSPTAQSPTAQSPTAQSPTAQYSTAPITQLADALSDDQTPLMALEVVQPMMLSIDEDEATELAIIDERAIIDPDNSSASTGPLHRMDQPVVAGPVPTSAGSEKLSASLTAKRYRPPVAVTSVPLGYQRDASEPTAMAQPAVASASKPKLDEAPTAALDLPAGVQLTPLYLSRAQVRSLTVGGQLRGVKVIDKSVCQAFSSGPNQLKLIGTGNGVTQLVVWAGADGEQGQVRMRAFEIHVADEVNASGSAAVQNTDQLMESIRGAFPNCQINVRVEGSDLVVSGRCDSDDSATKILRLVRKTCLVPVRDELKVH